MIEILIPKRDSEQDSEPADAPRIQAEYPAHALRPAPDREAQRQLREQLRYRQYQRAGTLGTLFATIGGQIREGRGPWFWAAVAVVLAYAWVGF